MHQACFSSEIREAHRFSGSTTVDASGRSQRTRARHRRSHREVDLLDGVQIATGYRYGPFGLLERSTDAQGNALRFEYDRLGRVTRNVSADSGTLDFVFNAMGEFIGKTHAESGQDTTYAYDSIGRLTQIDGPDGETTFTWDASANGIDALASTMSPDAVEKRGPDSSTVYAGSLYERRTRGAETVHVFHVHGPDGPIAQLFRNNVDPVVPTFVAVDALGTIGASIDRQGIVTARSYYERFGKRINPGGSTFTGAAGELRRGFTSHEHDDELGLVNMWAGCTTRA